MGFDNLKLEKGMYRQTGKSFTQVLVLHHRCGFAGILERKDLPGPDRGLRAGVLSGSKILIFVPTSQKKWALFVILIG